METGFQFEFFYKKLALFHGIDIDPAFIKDISERQDPKWAFTAAVHDMLSGPVERKFDAAYSLDVLEHIAKENERTFIENVVKSLTPDGVFIVGMPSLQSQTYASPLSKIGHVNCKTGTELKKLMQDYFQNVFMFSMNDEVVHTGFESMAQYVFAMGVGVIS